MINLKIVLLIVIALAAGVSSFAGEELEQEREIVILSSIRNSEFKTRGLFKRGSVEFRVNKRFNRAFEESGYKYKIIHKATQQELIQYLNSPKTLALFWVSHAAQSSQSHGGAVSLGNTILDFEGNNVAPLFQKVHPNMQGLYIIGCESKSIFEGYKSKGYYEKNPNLKIFGFDRKVGINKAIKRSLQHASNYLHNFEEVSKFRKRFSAIPNLKTLPQNISNDSEINSVAFTVDNIPANYVAQIKAGGGRFLGLISSSKSSFTIPRELLENKTRLKLIVTMARANDSELPILNFSSFDMPVNVDYMKKRDGSIFGSFRNIYYLTPQ